ncbi:17385_t:CDS:1 [Dentiscutata heterogama]|uniref:17385_t:CDS:1 n=1 Tax=Dentiscutata heterogama TaxID=1316150 RepID=A0ACA9MLX7_9GLOM|nr:17385_t:CDS:1 [Dentiscutata heterogama]
MTSQDSQVFSREITLLIEKEFEAEITLLFEKSLSISPKEFKADELAQNFHHKITTMPNVNDIYKLVIKLKVEKCGSFNDLVVDRFGDLLWYTVSETERNKIEEEYEVLRKDIIKELTLAPPQPTISTTVTTNEQSFNEIFYMGIVDYMPPKNFNNPIPDSMDFIQGITTSPQTN